MASEQGDEPLASLHKAIKHVADLAADNKNGEYLQSLGLAAKNFAEAVAWLELPNNSH